MKSVLIILSLAVSVTAAFAQDQRDLARVQKIGEKEVYILNEPVDQYETVDEVRTGIKWTSLLTRGIVNEHVNDKTRQFVRRASRKLEKKGETFDAILYRDGKRIEAIRFTSRTAASREGLAKVSSRNGIPVYVMAEPLGSYKVIEQVDNSVNLIPFITYGIVNNSIERDIKTLARRAANQDAGNVALIYQTGRRADLITFQE